MVTKIDTKSHDLRAKILADPDAVLEDDDVRDHLGMDVAVDGYESRSLEDLGARGIRRAVLAEVEGLDQRHREDVVVDAVVVRERHGLPRDDGKHAGSELLVAREFD